ncbi:adenosine deaminase [Chondromyces apiculatus]|uniref:adenosine deaminase n=1 Tax=Chondromyces apiculatus DSM 436 TaxID=1192034 RepID=A0A017SWH3_9BACT|nr:adenosine deaminase [Chondromyces apiculatus]EYF00656.1 Adenosine deaminase [Chondromyces apiculatus DSM 436]
MADPSEHSGHKLPLEFFQQLPKTDLHVHLDGSIRLETLIDLARRDGIDLPSFEPAELRKAMNLGENCGSLVEYLKAFDVTLLVLQTEEALFRCAYELAEDAARENVRYMEVRYAPMLHTRQGLHLTSVVEAVLAGLRAAHDKLGIESAVILCGIRNISPESSLEMAELAVAYKGRGVVGFDLAGAEYDHPAKHHRAAFQLVRQNNINCTIHAGEAYGPESIAQALHVCGAHRIGHGCRLRESGDLLHYINDQRIPLEVCPSSNVQTGAVRDFASHPLKLYHNLGLRVTVNTDNRLVTDTTVSKELWRCHTEMGFSLDEIKALVVAGFKSAFLPFHVKQGYLRRVTQELERFHADGTISPESPEVVALRTQQSFHFADTRVYRPQGPQLSPPTEATRSSGSEPARPSASESVRAPSSDAN